MVKVPGGRTANYAKTSHFRTVLQLTPAALELHLQRLTEKLRSGVHGKVREAIQQSIARILVGVDGSLTIEAKPGGLLGLEGNPGQAGGQEDLTLTTLSTAGRQWKLIASGQSIIVGVPRRQ